MSSAPEGISGLCRTGSGDTRSAKRLRGVDDPRRRIWQVKPIYAHAHDPKGFERPIKQCGRPYPLLS